MPLVMYMAWGVARSSSQDLTLACGEMSVYAIRSLKSGMSSTEAELKEIMD